MRIFQIDEVKSQIENFINKDHEQPALMAVVGPTASGKTGLSVVLAQWLAKAGHPAEVVSMDSRQIYKSMDIGTAKVTEEEMEGVAHHMIDVVEPGEEFTLAHYKEMALEVIRDIQARGKMPILVGGTGLYYSAIVENFQVPRVPADQDLRLEMEVLAENDGVEAVYEILKEENPEAAKKIHPNNLRYVVRAIEVARAGDPEGKRIGDGRGPCKGEKLFEVLTLAIDWDREVLYERINGRVGDLVEMGLLDEVRGLVARGLNRENCVAMASHGYQEVLPYLNGEKELDECLDLVRKNTRNYAKRQMTWFRRYPDTVWVKGADLSDLKEQLK